MKKKIIGLFLGSSTGLIILFIIILVPVLMVLDFFGVNITPDGYVENNMEYAEDYKIILNKYLSNNEGYVSLERILYFYLADETLTFNQIYKDNLNKETKKMLPINEVCKLDRYKILEVCSEDKILTSNQINEEQSKPFSKPISFSSSSVTSFFMEERIVFETNDIHEAWDFAAPAGTPVYSVCDGIVIISHFPYSKNITDTSGGLGNYIELSCDIEDKTYSVIYGHLFPNSSMVKKGETVRKGQKLAEVGTTGYSTGNHLHYAVLNNNKYIDGMSFVLFE